MLTNESNNDQESTSQSFEATSDSLEKNSQSPEWDSERMNTLAGFEDKNPVPTTTTENSAIESEESLLTEPDPYSQQTEQSFQNHPLSKLVLVSLTVLAIMATTGAILSTNLMGTSKPQRQLQQPAPTPKQEAQANLETERVGRVMTELALTSQGKELEALNEKSSQQPKPEQAAKPSSKPEQAAKPTTTRTTLAPAKNYSAAPRPRPVAAYSPPRSSTYTSIPKPFEQPKPIAKPIVSVAATAAATDPMKVWLAAAQLGSYGQLPGGGQTESVVAKAQNELQNSVMSPSNTIVTSFNPGIEYAAFDRRSKGQGGEGVVMGKSNEEQALTKLESEEAPILQEQSRQLISAGTKAKAILATPLVVDESEDKMVDERFTIILTEPLLAADGSVALPAKSQLVAELESFSEGGLVHLVAVAAITPGDEMEFALQEKAIQISGKQGKPLIAQRLFDKERRNGGRNIGRFALSSLKSAADLFDGSVEDVIESGAETLLDDMEERNKRSIQTLGERSVVSFLPAGTVIEVFVTRFFWVSTDSKSR